MKKVVTLAFILAVTLTQSAAQQKVSLKDSSDKSLDLSDWVVKAHGFIPIPVMITEPALGGIGGGLAALFVKPNAPYRDSVNGNLVLTRVKPSFYALAGAYTANHSWFAGGGSAGIIRKWRANYRLGTGYGNINLNFYRTTSTGNELSKELSMRAFPVYGQLVKQFGHSQWYAGINYLLLKVDMKNADPVFNTPNEYSSTVSRAGLLVEFDGRDNVFTPDHGFRWNALVASSAPALGSDYSFTSAFTGIYQYVSLSARVIAGFRMEYQQLWGDAPIYMYPFLNMRGFPVARYQGSITYLGETEWRWDVTPRHSVITFVGGGKAQQKNDDFASADWHVAGGAGWRYLLARKLKLRTGVDIARGPETWAVYLVVGTSWVR